MSKLDESVVGWIIREKRKGRRNKQIAETAGVSIRWVQRLWARYKDSPNIAYPLPMGRPVKGLPGRLEHSSVLTAKNGRRQGARVMESRIEEEVGIHIPHNTIHEILMENGLASEEPGRKKRRKWIRYERMHSDGHKECNKIQNTYARFRRHPHSWWCGQAAAACHIRRSPAVRGKPFGVEGGREQYQGNGAAGAATRGVQRALRT